MVLVRVEGRTAPSSATSAWTQPRTPSSACVATSSVGHVYISGWRPDLTDRCVQFAKLASAEIKSSRSMAGAALGSRTPERRPLPALKDRGQSQRTEGKREDLWNCIEVAETETRGSVRRIALIEVAAPDETVAPSWGFQGFGFGDGGFQMSFGIGAFPFGIFATAFNINDGRPPPAVPGTPQYVDEQFLSRLFLFVALVIMFWLLIA